MKKYYESPDLEYVSLIADEAITDTVLGGGMGLESSDDNDKWDED